MMITDMNDITTAADLNDRNNSDADAATPSAWPYTACSGILDASLRRIFALGR